MNFIIGPCVIENENNLNKVAEKLSLLSANYKQHNFYFKSSFDKANRTSLNSHRGPGMKIGLSMLDNIKKNYGLKLLTDIHVPSQASEVGDVVDIIQIPAFLCRQTDLIVEASKTNKIVNIKKGQFMSGADMKYSYEKATDSGASQVWLTERGNSFGYNNLVVDFRNLYEMKKITPNVVMDCTHSVQRPSFGGLTSGDRQFVPNMAYTALMWGISSFFIETHHNPDEALSDAANMLKLEDLESTIEKLTNLEKIK